MKNTKHLWRVTFDVNDIPGYRENLRGVEVHLVLDPCHGLYAATSAFMEWVSESETPLREITGVERVGLVGCGPISGQLG